MIWRPKARNKRVKASQCHRVDALKFKRKGDLTAFAQKHPGALTGYFLSGVHARMSRGIIAESKQLRDAHVGAWAQKCGGMTEARDIREVATLAAIMDAVNQEDLPHAMDIMAQRILAIQFAKKRGSSWEKAEALELVPAEGQTLLAGGLAALTQ